LDPTSRLRLATRIHFCLMRQFDEAVEVRDLLDGTANGREALWVCEASGDTELVALAQELKRATRRAAAAPVAALPPALRSQANVVASGRVPQDTSWSQDTSGFGLSRPPELDAKPRRAEAPSSWFAPMEWLRRGSAR
jgi:hypothetical protein